MSATATEGGSRTARGLLLVSGFLAGAFVALALLGWWKATFSAEAPAAALAPPRFIEETPSAGIDHTYDGEFPFFVGGGVAAFDCNDDRQAELYFAGGVNQAGLYRNDSAVGGDLRFTRLRDAATDMTEVTGAYPVDLDSDGRIDLAVLRLGENVVLRGLGDCRFERVNQAWAIDGGDEWTAAFSATWEGPAAMPTLAFGNYVALTEAGEQTGSCSDNALLRPDATGRYQPPQALSPGWCTLSILFSDWNRSGLRDLRMTNDRHYYRDGEDQLWRVAQGEPPRLYTREEGWQKLKIWGMGIASQDITGDGLPEVFLTSQGDNKLQTLSTETEEPRYEDIALRSGATAHRPFVGDQTRPSTAWHAEFQDVNNDGFTDLFVTKGNVENMPEFAVEDPNNLLLGQPEGGFVEAADAAGILDFARSRGAALADLNLDGMLDLVVVDRRENVRLWRNVGWGDASSPSPIGNWLALDLVQPQPNVDAIGAWVEVRADGLTTLREVTIGGGHAGGQVGWIHFGLGERDNAEIRVQWPDGEMGPWIAVDANQFVVIERDQASLLTWSPG